MRPRIRSRKNVWASPQGWSPDRRLRPFVVQLRGFKSEVYTLWLEVVKTQESLRFFQGLEKAALKKLCKLSPVLWETPSSPPSPGIWTGTWDDERPFSPFALSKFCSFGLQMSNKQQIATSHGILHPYTQHGRGETHGNEPPAGCLALATKVTFYWNWCFAILCCKVQLT